MGEMCFEKVRYNNTVLGTSWKLGDMTWRFPIWWGSELGEGGCWESEVCKHVGHPTVGNNDRCLCLNYERRGVHASR